MTAEPEAIPAVDELAQEIRRVDGSNSLGAGALAEALMPFLIRASRAPVDGSQAEPIGEPDDDFGAHILTGTIGHIDNREIGAGHVVLSEERYNWLLSHVAAPGTHPAPASPDAELVEEVAILERLADRYAEVGQSAADGMANLLRDEARHLRKTGRVGRSEREALSKHGGDRS